VTRWKKTIQKYLLDGIAGGIYGVDMDAKIQYWSRGAEIITGFSEKEIKGKPLENLTIQYEDNYKNPIQTHEHPVIICLQTQKPASKNLFIKTKENKSVNIEEKSFPAYKRNKMVGVISTIRDISNFIKTVKKDLKTEKKERLIPICGWCKKIKNDRNYWEQIEVYLTNEGFGIFTHGMCPECAEKIFEKKVYLESYQNISKAISSSIALDEVMKLIVSNVVKVMNVKASSLRLLNKETNQLELVSYYGLSEKYANKGPVTYDASIDDALAGKPVSVYDIAEHKESRYYKEALEEEIRSILSIPLRFQKEVIGVLRMYTSEPIKYTDEDLKFMTAIAEQGAIAIMNAKRFEIAISKEKEFLRVFEEISKAVSSTLHVQGVLVMIVKKIPEVMGLKAATIRLLDPTRKKLKLVAAHGLSQEYLNRGPVDTEENIIEALNEKPVAIFDVTTDRRVIYQKEAEKEGIKSMLTFPVIARGKIIGVLRLLTDKPKKFTRQEIDFAASLAEQCGIAIENATMYEKIKNEYDNIMRYFEGVISKNK
jgi:PAS domain S-box-containing protein